MSGQSASPIDQIVKGAAPLGTSVKAVASRSPSPAPSIVEPEKEASPSDPLATLPSSPPQIYLNLLILEASLRAQYLTLRARRRENIFFLLLLSLWISFFFWALFLRPREDGSGVGGSVYWVVEMTEKVALMGGIVTSILVWGTGQWERGVRWPRRFVGVANRGLRTMNAKIVVIKGPWWKETLSHLTFLFPYSSLFPSQRSSYHVVPAAYIGIRKRANSGARRLLHTEDDVDVTVEEDLAPGGDYIKLLLLPKPFSPDFRENWELYRTEYWEKENERRASLLQRIRQQERQKARELGGWLWWTGWRGWRSLHSNSSKEVDLEKTHHRRVSEKDSRMRLGPKRAESGHSRNSSRSSTMTTEGDERPKTDRLRRGSSSSESRKRGKGGLSLGSELQFSKMKEGLTPTRSPLIRAGSTLSVSSGNESDRSVG